MNFHKKIGFLVVLLLMLGLGVPDSFAQTQTDVGEIEITRVTPKILHDNRDETLTVMVTVSLTEDVTAATDYTVTLSAVSDDLTDPFSVSTTTDITISVPKDSKVGDSFTGEGTLVFDMLGDADNDTDVVTITAVAAGYFTAGTGTVEIRDYSTVLPRNAEDAAGFRVIIAKPGDGAWVKATSDAVRVQLKRRVGLASHFANFSMITVSLYEDDGDDAKNDAEEYGITVSENTSNPSEAELSSLASPNVKTDTLTSAVLTFKGGNLEKIDESVFYTRRSGSGSYDTLEFRFNIKADDNAVDLTKVYAVAMFSDGGGKTLPILDSRDTETSIYPDDPSSFPDKVGDGKSIKIDRSRPAEDIISSLSVMINDKAAAANEYAGIGDVITISANINGSFREHSVVYQILGTEDFLGEDEDGNMNAKLVKKDQVLSGYSKTISSGAIFADGDDALTQKVTVTSGQFKRKYNLDPAGDAKKNSLFEDDNVQVKVRAQVKDKAGNARSQTATSAYFKLDSKPPKVTILYPKPSGSDSTIFTAEIEQVYDFLEDASGTQTLRPLKFEVDEGTTEGYIIIGTDTLLVGGRSGAAQSYDLTDEVTYPLKNDGDDNKRPEDDSAQGGGEVDLVVVAIDSAGNEGPGTPSGGNAVFDAKAPKIDRLFPNTAALGENQKVGGAEGTQNPVFRINEAADSISVRYSGGGSYLEVTRGGSHADLSKVNENIKIAFTGDNALEEGETYDLQVYVRDHAHNVGVSTLEEGLTYEAGLSNPQADEFKIVSAVRNNTLAKDEQDADAYTAMDSVVAGQALRLTITAHDKELDRPAATYNRADVTVVAMDSDGAMVSSVSYWGGGVTDNGDGSATLDDDGWLIGERDVFMKTNVAMTGLSVVAKDMTSEGVLNFNGTKEGLVVDAADFAQFELSAWEDGLEVNEVWEGFDLLVVPTDRYGNPSLKSFVDKTPGTGSDKADSLSILDTRKPKTYTEVDVDFSAQLVEDLPLVWPVGGDGQTFSLTAFDRPGKTLYIRARVDNTYLDADDLGSQNASGNLSAKIVTPLMPVLTLWVPGSDQDEAGNDVVIPADPGNITVTVAAEGFTAGRMVTFAQDGAAGDPVTADDDGVAKLTITASEAGSVTVSASSGQYSTDELTITFVDTPPEPVHVAYTDADGNPVYLVSDTDMTVGTDDFLAFVAAYGSSKGDENYNVQADLDDDGDVDLEDYLAFIASYGKIANGPLSKPLVLLPGINENAEFSLSLGSERVVYGELVAVDVSLANVEALMGYGFALNYETDKFEFVSVAPANSDLLASTGGETLFHHVVADGQITVASGLYNGTAVSGGGDIVRFVFRVLREFEENARFEIADGLVFDPSQLQNPAVVAGVLELQSTPREFALHQNFPNPFNPDTTIKYDLAESADVTLQIYNVLGQVVRTLVASEVQDAGRYQIRWNGMNDRGVPVSSGVYFYQISADGKFHHVLKLMLLK